MNWLRVGLTTWRGVAALLVLAALALLGWTRWSDSQAVSGERQQPQQRNAEGDMAVLPGLDRAQPEEYATATFALG